MSALLQFLTLDQTCIQVQAWATHQLTRAGFRVQQTFDLQMARSAHPNCPCPHHGTDDCNCQLVVLLVYRKHEEPATLVIHGQDNQAWLSLAGPVGKRANQHLEAAIRRVLMDAVPTDVLSPIEVTDEARTAI